WLALQEAVADAERRDPEAAFLAALAVMQGHYPGVETEEAVDLLKDSAESGYLPARTFVALFQISGVHPQAIPLDREAGAEALDATYEAGDAEAAYRLGIAHSEGSYGYPLDLRKATRYMEAALERGHRRGLFPLGFLRAE